LHGGQRKHSTFTCLQMNNCSTRPNPQSMEDRAKTEGRKECSAATAPAALASLQARGRQAWT
jgi:hypothetical protein